MTAACTTASAQEQPARKTARTQVSPSKSTPNSIPKRPSRARIARPASSSRIVRQSVIRPITSPRPKHASPSADTDLGVKQSENDVRHTPPVTESSDRLSESGTPPRKAPNQRPKSVTRRKRTMQSIASTQPAPNDDSDSESANGRGARNPRRRRLRNPKPNSNQSFSLYMDEISASTLLEQQEVVKLSNEIRAGMEVEEAQRVLSNRLKRRPALPEIAEYLKRSPDQVRDALLRGSAAKNKLVASNLRLVTSVCRRMGNIRGTQSLERSFEVGFGPVNIGFDDMVQEGSVGLIRAAEKYDASLGYKFSTYATWWIRASVMRAISRQSRSIRVPSTVIDDYTRIKKEYERQQQAGQFAPTDADVAHALGITTAKLRFTVNVVTRTMASLDISVGSTNDGNLKSSLGELIEGDDHVEERMVEHMQRVELDRALKLVLRPIERAAVRLRFGLDDGHPRTLREIGRMLGLSKERVRQISFKALAKLNTPEMRRTLSDVIG